MKMFAFESLITVSTCFLTMFLKFNNNNPEMIPKASSNDGDLLTTGVILIYKVYSILFYVYDW